MISSISSSNNAAMLQSMQQTQKKSHSSAQVAETLFSMLDTSGQGYLQKSDLESVLSSSTGSASSAIDAVKAGDELFAKLDSNSDGQLTQQELADSLQNLADQLTQQFDSARMQASMAPPPPPPEDDEGLSKEEITQQLNAIGNSDSALANTLSTVAENFEKADTNQDGKVSFQEAMAYERASGGNSANANANSSTTSSTSSASSAASGTDNAGEKLLSQIMRLVKAYSAGETESSLSSLSVSA